MRELTFSVSIFCETVTTKQDQLLERKGNKNDKFADDFHFTDLINSWNNFADASDEVSKLNQKHIRLVHNLDFHINSELNQRKIKTTTSRKDLKFLRNHFSWKFFTMQTQGLAEMSRRDSTSPASTHSYAGSPENIHSENYLLKHQHMFQEKM